MGRPPAVALCLLASLGVAVPVRAQQQPTTPFPVALEWSAPPGCPTAASVVGELRRLVGDAPAAAAADLRARAIVARVSGASAGPALLLTLTVDRRGEPLGERRIEGESCEALGGAAALVLALLIDPDAIGRVEPETLALIGAPDAPRGDDPAPSPPAQAPPQPSAMIAVTDGPRSDGRAASGITPAASSNERPRAGPVEAAVRAAEAPADTREHPAATLSRGAFRIGAALVFDAGTLPSLGVGPAVTLGWATGPVVLELGGLWLPTQRDRVLAEPSAGGRLYLLAAHAGLCVPVLRDRVLDFAPCARFEAGVFQAEGQGVSDPRAASGPWAALRLDGALTVSATGWLRLRLELGLSVPLVRPHFLLGGVGELHQPSAVVGRGLLGVEVRFP